MQSDRLPESLVSDMIDLGILSQDDDTLPCLQDGRMNHPEDWYYERKRYREHRAKDPDAPPYPREDEEWEAFRKRRLPTVGAYACPIRALVNSWDEEPPLACIEARRRQRDTKSYQEDPKKLQLLDDPADPVNALQLRPCRVLATVLFDEILVKVARRQRLLDQERYPHGGKPRA